MKPFEATVNPRKRKNRILKMQWKKRGQTSKDMKLVKFFKRLWFPTVDKMAMKLSEKNCVFYELFKMWSSQRYITCTLEQFKKLIVFLHIPSEIEKIEY